jgi:2-polyprenyl-6-methoxyphenol hydroxylase-like FAD-dependent oxidoreductase
MSHVIVVGAGPAGVAIAYLLARHDIQVSLLERETQFDHVFRGEGLMPSGVDALDQMGLGDCLKSIPSRMLDAWDFYIDGQRRMRVVEPQQQLGKRSTRIIHQSALLKAIAERAKQSPHFQFYPGWRVRDLLRRENRVCGVTATQDNQTQEFYADLVIASDGRYSQLRKLAGLTLDQAATQFDVLWFKLPASAEVLCETVFAVCLQQTRQFAYYPSWDERLQIGWIVEKGQAKAMGDRDWIEEFAQAAPTSLADHFRQHRQDLEGPMFLDVIVGLAPQWSVPGLLLAGDAAHPMAPNRAQGINMAFRDAIAIANHLVPLLQSNWSAQQLTATLQAIQAERQPEIEAAQHLQLEEWQKIAFFTQSPLTYYPFKTLATALGRFGITQQAWLWQQRGLRYGTQPIKLTV